MSDDLTRLTPTTGGLHRDDLIFAAGRASAPSPRWWRRGCGALLAANALLLWRAGGVSPLIQPPPVTPVDHPEPSPLGDGIRGLTPPARPDESEPPHPSSYIALLRGGSEPPAAATPPAPTSPPLTAGSSRLLD